jgi:Leucine-rich repeat (LRR) protein
LPSLELPFSLPAALGNLTQLTFFDLSYNNFSGQIPSSLSNLKDLTLIDLSYNNFEGRIDFLTNLTKLTQVDLSYNQLTSQIGEFQPSNSLQILRLKNNRLYGSIPKSISNLVNLTELDISSNDLSGIVEFDKSTKPSELQFLDLSYNSRLLGIKSNFNDTFPALRSLNLVSCNIIEFPNFLKSSKNLERLDLSNNKIYNQVPEWMFEVGENLVYLNLSHNFLSSIDQLPWKNLRNLDLRANLLQGKLPAPPYSIEIFLISNNSLIGSIPSMICNASSLRVLDISRNRLGGTVPQCLGNFSNDLVVMDLRMNNFHGTIPDTFVKDNQLTTLVFNGNQLEGQLPKSLVNCTKLEVLDLGNNKIIDFFPSWLEALPELKILVLKSNRFHGPIGNHKSSGEFFTKLRILDLSHNEFTGLLPRNYFQNLNAMMTIEGETLQYLGESDYYQDSVVVTMKGTKIELERILSIFTTIDSSCNKFEGEIPEVLGRLTILRLLNLSHNSLTSHIPLSLANLSALESIDLSSNKLTGEIPMQLTSLTFLAMLNLSQNQLTGPIPQGKQFDTFENNSYYGNLGLCGLPLSIKCRTDASPLPSPSIFQEDNDSMFASGFGWKAVLMGYGCGFVFGLAVGYVFWFKTRKPQWLVRFFDGGNGKAGWPNNQRPWRRS